MTRWKGDGDTGLEYQEAVMPLGIPVATASVVTPHQAPVPRNCRHLDRPRNTPYMTIVGKEGLGVACLDWSTSTHLTNLQLQSAGGLLGITGNKKGGPMAS